MAHNFTRDRWNSDRIGAAFLQLAYAGMWLGAEKPKHRPQWLVAAGLMPVQWNRGCIV